MKLQLMTWNLGKNKPYGKQGTALDLACKWIKQGSDPKVVAFQECPDPGEIRKDLPGFHVENQGTICLLSSTPLSCVEKQERFIAAKTTVSGREICLFSLHGYDRMNHADATDRGGKASEYRWLIDSYVGASESLILGDFNSTPDSMEIQGRWCFSFASKDGEARTRSHGRDRNILRVIRATGNRGTYFWSKPQGGLEPRWETIDFIVASDALSKRIKSQNRTHLGAMSLFKGPEKTAFSDHLPVLGTLEL